MGKLSINKITNPIQKASKKIGLTDALNKVDKETQFIQKPFMDFMGMGPNETRKKREPKNRYDPKGAGKRLRKKSKKTTSKYSKRLYELMAKNADKKESKNNKFSSFRGGIGAGLKINKAIGNRREKK